MKKFIAGFIVGALLTLGSSVFAAQVQKYILTEAPYPIFVNGVEYKDRELPILNYNGSTYIPLAKMGDLTGVNYKWNDELKRVEINTSSSDPTDTSNNEMETTTSNNNNTIISRELIENEIIKQYQENTKFEIVEEPIEEPSADEVIQNIEKLYQNQSK